MKPKNKYFPSKIGGLDHVSLEYLLEQVENLGIKKKDYSKIIVELDYDSCFYESDVPSIALNLENIQKDYNSPLKTNK